MTKADVETMIIEVRDGVRVLRNEAVETRRVLKMLVGVINDTQHTLEGLRLELHHIRTSRERTDRAAQLAAVVGLPQTTPEET